jgi:pre-rRNA-processing protein TSR4
MHLELDNKDPNAIDWGTIIFYTCSKHCDGANGNFSEEFFIKQDFSSAGVGDSARKEIENLRKEKEP